MLYYRISAGLSLACTALLPGCTSPENDRLAIGPLAAEPVLLEAFSGSSASDAGERTDDAPSLEGVSRENWGGQRFIVPMDATVHAPTWVWFTGYPGQKPRDVGAFPTALTALDGPHDDRMLRTAETLAGPTWAALEVLAVPVRLFTDQQSGERRSPSYRYERTPGGGS